jgi:hypothetical protein
MSEQDQLTPKERELERALRSLRPAAARFDLAVHAEAAHESRWRTFRAWSFAAAAALAGVALWIALATSSPRRPDPPVGIASDGVAAAEPVEPPTEFVYRRALMRSTAEFDELLDQHAAIVRDQDDDEARIGVVMFWRSDLQPPSGAL